MKNNEEIKEMVKQTYSEIALQNQETNASSCCGSGGCSTEVYNIMSDEYDHLGYNPDADLKLGCGHPTAFAKIKQGDTVVDLGSGAGSDCFVSRHETGESGKVIGVDFSGAMIDKARINADKLGYNNVEFRLGDIEKVPNVWVALEGSNMPGANTNNTGKYEFPEMKGGGTYDVIPVRDDNDLEGVSTLDLIFIQKHILKSQELNSPYKIIAADVNKDDKVSASDILQLRKLILGIYEKFPDNTSWSMVDRAHTFLDPKDPFRGFMPESYHIENLNSNMNIDWVGVKIGDVNSSYVTNAKDKNDENRSSNLSFRMNEMKLVEGTNIVPVMAAKDDDINGRLRVWRRCATACGS